MDPPSREAMKGKLQIYADGEWVCRRKGETAMGQWQRAGGGDPFRPRKRGSAPLLFLSKFDALPASGARPDSILDLPFLELNPTVNRTNKRNGEWAIRRRGEWAAW